MTTSHAIFAAAVAVLLIGSVCAASTLQSKCNSLCSVCETLHQVHRNEMCSHKRLGPCDCVQFVIRNSSIETNNCPVSTETGFCPLGEEKDPISQCPLGHCTTGPGCPTPQQWAHECQQQGKFCPNGYATNAHGCPTCACRCEEVSKLEKTCADTCSSLGATPQLIPGEQCPICTCKINNRLGSECQLRCSKDCGHHGYVNTTKDSDGCITDCSCNCSPADARTCPDKCPITWSTDEFGCQVCRCAQPDESYWCPAPPNCTNDCGRHGYTVSQASGCRMNCACNCPPTTKDQCPSNCHEVQWVTDKHGCSVCKCRQRCQQRDCPSCGELGYRTDENSCPTCQCRCPSEAEACPGTTCETWATDEFGCPTCRACRAQCMTRAEADINRLCPADCGQFLLLEDPKTRCLTCTCQTDCSPEPNCLIGCGPHQRKRDRYGCVSTCDCLCPQVSLSECRANCNYNASIVRDPYGCPTCKCEEAPRCERLRCPNDCGQLGYEAGADGCQTSCKCNCPQRNCPQVCSIGAHKDQFGCDTCRCITIAEYFRTVFMNDLK